MVYCKTLPYPAGSVFLTALLGYSSLVLRPFVALLERFLATVGSCFSAPPPPPHLRTNGRGFAGGEAAYGISVFHKPSQLFQSTKWDGRYCRCWVYVSIYIIPVSGNSRFEPPQQLCIGLPSSLKVAREQVLAIA